MQNSLSATVVTGSEVGNVKEERVNPVCYTPERLIRSQEYRILVPSPHRFAYSQARFTPENESGEWKFHRKRLSRFIDPRQIGTQSEVFLTLVYLSLLLLFSRGPRKEAQMNRARFFEPAPSKAIS